MSVKSEQKKRARRKPLRGYPIEIPFSNMDEVREYTSGERVVCLLCGREFKKLGSHIEKIHGITRDEYREMYNIPYRHPLSCEETKSLYSANMKKRIDDGDIILDPEIWKVAVATKKRVPKFKGEIALQNLAEHSLPKRPLVEAEDGTMETFTSARDRQRTKRGTPEFVDKMRARPQCQPDVTRFQIGSWWKGKQQSEEHKRKRFLRMKKEEPDAPDNN